MFSTNFACCFLIVVAVTICHVASLAQVPNGPHRQLRYTDKYVLQTAAHPPRIFWCAWKATTEVARLVRLLPIDSKVLICGLQPAQYSVKVHQTGYRDAQQTVDMQTSSSGLVLLQLSKDTSKVTTSTTGTINAAVPAAAQKEFDKGIAVLAGGGKDKMNAAAKSFEKAITIYPQFVEARLRLGTVYMDLEQWDKAKNALEETLQVDPRAANAFFALSEIYLRQNKLSQAEQVLMKGLAIDDRSFLGHLNLARVNWEQARQIKDLNQAKPVLEKCYQEVKQALVLNPNLAGAHLLKGNLLLRVARTSEAVSEFDEYLRLEPNGPMANETRALVDKIKKASSTQRNFHG